MTEHLTINYSFQNLALLNQALTHRSYAPHHNERLEFLGDSVLNNVITHQLYLRFTTATEGELSLLRSNLVRQATLLELAQELDLSRVLRFGPGHLSDKRRYMSFILADTLEALIGAIYLDGGALAAERFILEIYHKKLNSLRLDSIYKDPKSCLQERLQAQKLHLPNYQLMNVTGEPPLQLFVVDCVVEDLNIRVRGEGRSRRMAEQQSAQQAILLWQEHP